MTTDRSRDQLVATTARLLRRQGYVATGVKQILTESGVTTGSLYHHFPGGKEALAEAALTHSAEQVRTALVSALDTFPEPADALAAWTRAAAAALARHPADGCPIASIALESVQASEPLRAAAAAAFRSWEDVLVERLIQVGYPAADARPAGSVVLAMMEGALLLARTSGSTAALDAAADAIHHHLAKR